MMLSVSDDGKGNGGIDDNGGKDDEATKIEILNNKGYF